MDPSQLAAEITNALTPYLPYLLTGGSKIAEGAATKLGEKFTKAGWDGASKLWAKLKPKVEAKSAALEAVQDVAKAPDDADAIAAFRQQLKKILVEDSTLANELQVWSVGGDLNTVNIGAWANVGAVAVGREIHQHIYPYPQAALEPRGDASLTEFYLRRLAYACATLPFGVLDKRFLELTRGSELKVSDVYIDLDVSAPASREETGFLKRTVQHETDIENPGAPDRVPILDALARPELDRVVLLGEMGSGKSTFVQYVAYALALIRQNVPHAQELLPENSPLLPLFPVRVVLRSAARAIPLRAAQGTAAMLWDALRTELVELFANESDGDAFLGELRQKLRREPALIFFDGLDEVPEADERRAHLVQAITAFAAGLANGSRVIVTARPYAYDDPAWKLPQFSALTLAPFSDEQVARFIARWYEAVRPAMQWDERTASGKAAELGDALAARTDLGDIATRPLLLTLMATLSTSGGTLPNDRFELYEEMVRLLLSRWQRAALVQKEDGTWETDPGISKTLSMDENAIRQALHRLAATVHERQRGETERRDEPADISRAEVLDAFEPLFGEDAHPKILLRYLNTRAGLLTSRKPNVYAFPHRSFQEYLAACDLKDRVGESDALCDVTRLDPRWWREVFLWGAGIKARGGPKNVIDLVNWLLPAEPDRTPNADDTDYRLAVLAGLALYELKTKPIGQPAYEIPLARVRQWLVALIEQNRFSARERVEAGDVLGKLDDPRRGVGARAGLPDLIWCEIPAGPFWMGSSKNQRDPHYDPEAYVAELGMFKMYDQLTRPYYIARYPITNAQFETFLQAPDGYANPHWWKGLAETDNQTAPPKYSGVYSLPNHPMINVTWYQAVAFTRWCTEQLRKSGAACLVWQPGTLGEHRLNWNEWQVRLPSEAEWEKAACWDGVKEAKRKYPWGPKFSTEHANTAESGIGATSAVGCFSTGVSPCGALDLSGNVWEWCLTGWTENFEGYDSTEDNTLQGAERRVVRGGSFDNASRGARCAYRVRVNSVDGLRYQGLRVVLAPA